MEFLKVGYATVPLEEYKEMIQREQHLEKVIDDMNITQMQLKKRASLFENKFLNELYQEKNWTISQLPFENGSLQEDGYYYRDLVQQFTDLGIMDIEYIRQEIVKLHDKYVNEKKGGKENE